MGGTFYFSFLEIDATFAFFPMAPMPNFLFQKGLKCELLESQILKIIRKCNNITTYLGL